MKAAFHYIVKAKLIRQTEGNELDFEEINKKFENENPIIAREEAFNHYQSWIDILLQHKGKKYVTDGEARKDLSTFIDPGATIKLNTGDKEIEFNNESFGNGIGVYFVLDISVESVGSYFDVGDEALIHGIGNLSNQYMMDDIIIDLHEEAEYYEHFNYETRNKEIEVTFCAQSDTAISTHKILKTPFNWEGYDKPYWWGKSEEKIVERLPKPIEEIIRQGESNTVEFKSTLFYNKVTKKADSIIKEMVAKTICAFLNSNGGLLLIGINDDGSVGGLLDFDFSLANRKNPNDYFLQQFDNMQKHFIDFSITSNIWGQFHELDGKLIFVVEVSKNNRRLIFLKGKEVKELYVRGQASTRHIKDAEEIINYYKDRQVD